MVKDKHSESVRSFQESIAAIVDEDLDKCLSDAEFYSLLIDESTGIATAHILMMYRIARNFRGLKFSRMSLAQTFRDLIFEDCVRARRRLTVGKVLKDKFFEVHH